MASERELNKMAEDVRVQGGQGTGSMNELVYNNETGEFETVTSSSANIDRNGLIVTDMTKEGFAFFPVRGTL